MQAIATRAILVALAKQLRVLEPIGLVWKPIGAKRPPAGKEIFSEGLCAALRHGRTTFTDRELTELDVQGVLRVDSYVKVSADDGQQGTYFRPVGDRLRPVVQAVKKLDALGKSSNLAFLPQQLEEIASRALAAWGTLGSTAMPRYAAGQWLTVRRGEADWIDTQVSGGKNVPLELRPGVLDTALLSPWNHAPRQLPMDAFATALGGWREAMRARHSRVADVLTGRELDVMQQCVSIDITGDELAGTGIEDSRSLAAWLRKLHKECCTGNAVTSPLAVLITAGPATGKTSMLSQMVMHSLEGDLVPILVKVHQLQAEYISAPDAFAASWNWIDAYVCRTQGGPASSIYRLLRQAMLSRRALLLLDGLDEGGRARAQIERHVTEVLAPQGHVIVATARPSGVNEDIFVGFRRLTLSPLSEQQQCAVIENRLSVKAQVSALVAYLERVPRDAETGNRVCSNPLMLSMIISISELRQGLEMPSTVARMYEIAAQAMLERNGVVSSVPQLNALLLATFFEAHVTQQRVLGDRQLIEAALALRAPAVLAELRERARSSAPIGRFRGTIALGQLVEVVAGDYAGQRGVLIFVDNDFNSYKAQMPNGQLALLKAGDFCSSGLTESGFLSDAMQLRVDEVLAACDALPLEMRATLDAVRQRVRMDTLPLLSLLTADPLQMQSSHLSFQEYFAARAICEGTPLSGVSPWQFPAWWANALKLGEEIGQPFRHGLKQSARVDEQLNLNGRIDGHRPTALHAVSLLMPVLLDVNLWGNQINGSEALVLAEALAVDGCTLTTLNLGTNELGDEGAAHFAAALPRSPSLKVLDLSRNQIGVAGGRALATAIESRQRSGNVLDTCFLWRNNFSDKVKAALAPFAPRVKV